MSVLHVEQYTKTFQLVDSQVFYLLQSQNKLGTKLKSSPEGNHLEGLRRALHERPAFKKSSLVWFLLLLKTGFHVKKFDLFDEFLLNHEFSTKV